MIIETKSSEPFTQNKWSTVVKGKVSNKLSDVPITKTALTRTGKGFISFPNRESRDLAADVLKDEFAVSQDDIMKKTLLPKMKICDLQSFTKTDCDKLKSEIPRKNSKIQSLLDSGATLDVIYIREAANTELYGHAVIRVDPRIREAIIDNKRKLYIDTSSYYVKDQIHVTQCFACQSFGHKRGSSFCPLVKTPNKNICLYCSENHLSHQCTVKKDASKYNCSNCSSSKYKSFRNDSNHTSTSSQCPIHLKEINTVINRTIFNRKNYPLQRTIPMLIRRKIS